MAESKRHMDVPKERVLGSPPAEPPPPNHQARQQAKDSRPAPSYTSRRKSEGIGNFGIWGFSPRPLRN